jgi:hydroxymethylbilane synthase
VSHPNDAGAARVRLGTRDSPLARWQAEWVAARLSEGGVVVELIPITTQGDVSDRPLGAIGGQGLFTKEIQRALLDGRIDLAVHSLKDLPTDPVAGLTLAAVPPRESPRDVLVSTRGGTLDELPAGARVGTGSRRRQSQLLHLRPDLRVADIRGNVDTRLRKLDAGQFDAIVLAEAGLSRLNLAGRITQVLPSTVMLPAVGQGALGLETRADDAATLAAVARLDDAATRAAVLAERALLAGLRGGCMAPVAAWARITDRELRITAAVLSVDGQRRVAVTRGGDAHDPVSLGQLAAEELLSLGAGSLIDDARTSN